MMDDLGSLSAREREVLQLVATGATNQEIARALVISPNTVKVHLRNIFEKLGVQSRTEATMEAVRRGWVPVAGVAVTAGEQEGLLSVALPASQATATDARRPARPPIERWQRIYMVVVGLLVITALLAPGWRSKIAGREQNRSQAAPLTSLSDVGQAQVAPEVRSDVARWTSYAPLPESRSRFALVSGGSKLYAIGGETPKGVTNRVDIYDPQSNGWLPGARKPTPVSNVAGASLGGHIYVPGGTLETGGVTNVFEVYDPAADTWETHASLPVPLAGYALSALDGKIYVFGGWDGTSYRAETYMYDPATDSWATATSLPEPRAFMAASALRGVIYVVGGYDGEREVDRVEAYDPAGEGTKGGPWSSRASLSQARGGLGLAAVGSRLYAVGGGWTTPLAFNEQYDLQTGAWSRIDTPVVGQWRNLGLAAQGPNIYAIGGWSGSYLALTEAYQALFRSLLPFGGKGG